MDEIKPRAGRRSYGQFCALARSLDVVGERWTLLIVRELLPGPLRYTELKSSLHGVATNLLAGRLRAMENDGLVERRIADSGVVYALTPWGAELRQPLEALGRWGAPLLATGQGNDVFEPRWLTLALPALLHHVTASPPIELGIDIDGFTMVLRVDEQGPCAFAASNNLPEALLTIAPDVVVGLATGAISVEGAKDSYLFKGEPDMLRAVFARQTT